MTSRTASFLDGASFSTSSADLVVAWFQSITGREPTRDDVRYRNGVFTAVVSYPDQSQLFPFGTGATGAPRRRRWSRRRW